MPAGRPAARARGLASRAWDSPSVPCCSPRRCSEPLAPPRRSDRRRQRPWGWAQRGWWSAGWHCWRCSRWSAADRRRCSRCGAPRPAWPPDCARGSTRCASSPAWTGRAWPSARWSRSAADPCSRDCWPAGCCASGPVVPGSLRPVCASWAWRCWSSAAEQAAAPTRSVSCSRWPPAWPTPRTPSWPSGSSTLGTGRPP